MHTPIGHHIFALAFNFLTLMYKPKDMFVDLFDLVKALKEKSSLTIFLRWKYDFFKKMRVKI